MWSPHLKAILYLCVTLALPVTAQETGEQSGTGPAATSSNAEVNSYDDWSVQCVSNPDSEARKCVLFQHLKVDSGQRLLTMQVSQLDSVAGQRDAMALVVTVPLGVHLPSGMRLQMDGNEIVKLDYERCDQGGCYAGTVLSAELLEAMMQEGNSQIVFNNLTGKSITATLSLRGFTAGFKAVEAS